MLSLFRNMSVGMQVILLLTLPHLAYGQAPDLDLTPAEQAFLIEKPSVRMCVDPNWLPYEAIVNGEHVGIGGDLLKLIFQRSGLTLNLVRSESWSETLSLFQAGQCDILSMLNQTVERDKFMDYTRPYFKGHIVFVSKNEYPFIGDPSEVEGKRIAVAKGYSIAEFLRRDFQTVEVVEVEDYDVAFEMVATGEVDLSADYLISAGDRIQERGLFGLKIAGNTDYKNELRIGVQKGAPVLRSILDKAVGTLEIHEINKVVNNWRTVRYEQTIDYTLVWILVSAAVIVFAITFYWNSRLVVANSRANEALQELEKAQRQLERLATLDKLTGLYNRTKMDETLTLEVNRAERFNTDFGIVLLDVDHFKQVNDNWGHLVGDKVLRDMAEIIKVNTRATDVVGRWGGEEFMIICPSTDKDGLMTGAEKLRQKLAAHDFPEIGRVTASFGIAIFRRGENIDSTISRADRALYNAKEGGRNRVEAEA